MSDEKQESMADIVADIRERAENAMRNGERLVHNEAVAMLLRSIADRIEAAWKREKAEWEAAECTCVSNAVMSGEITVKHKPVGNATAKKHRRKKADDPSKILHEYWRTHYEV